MFHGSKVTELESPEAAAETDALIYSHGSFGYDDPEIGDLHAELSESFVFQIESHSERISCFIAELSTIMERACEAALKGAQHADRMEERLMREFTSLRRQLKKKDASLLGLEMALATSERIAKEKLEELKRRLQAHESQLSEQQIELQRLRSGREYLTYRIDEIQAAAKEAEIQAARIKEGLKAEVVECKLKVAQYEQWLAEKETQLKKQETGELKLCLRETDEKLAGRDNGIQTKKALNDFRARERKLEFASAGPQGTRKSRRAS